MNTIASTVSAASAWLCAVESSSVTSAKLSVVHPSACISASMVARCPEPGLPMLTRLPGRSSNVVIPELARATTVNGSACSENTERSSGNAPGAVNGPLPRQASY